MGGLTSWGYGTSERFTSANDFQKALWWYNGAMDTGIMAMPPLMSATDLLMHGSVAMSTLRGIFGGDANDGKAATNPIGKVSVPSLYVCGKSDSAILCDHDYSHKTSNFVSGNYTYLTVDC